MTKRELSGVYFRMGSENIDWLDLTPQQRAQILETKSTGFIRTLTKIIRDVDNEVCFQVLGESKVGQWDTLSEDRNLLMEQLEMVTSHCRLIADKYHVSRVDE